MTDAPLTTYLGQPIEPHEVDGVEATSYYCSRCGHEVSGDGDSWYHEDPKYDPPEDAPDA